MAPSNQMQDAWGMRKELIFPGSGKPRGVRGTPERAVCGSGRTGSRQDARPQGTGTGVSRKAARPLRWTWRAGAAAAALLSGPALADGGWARRTAPGADEISPVAQKFAAFFWKLGLPDIGVGLMNDLDLLLLLAAYATVAYVVAGASIILFRERAILARYGAPSAFLFGISGVLQYRASLPHPTLGTAAHMHLVFSCCAACGLSLLTFLHAFFLIRREAERAPPKKALDDVRMMQAKNSRVSAQERDYWGQGGGGAARGPRVGRR